MSASDEPSLTNAVRGLFRPATLIKSAALIVFLLVAIFVLEGLFGTTLSDHLPWTAPGTIFVDSPEVYTRERLVNDRYDEDYWLRNQLDVLDHSSSLLSGVSSKTIAAALGIAAAAPAKPESGSQGDVLKVLDALAHPPLQDEFSLRSSIRDRVRQLLLENMLDDRHDLTGNSVVGLKFDTTIIPRGGTRRRAFVRIAVRTDPLLGSLSKQPAEGVPDAVFAFYSTEARDYASNPQHPLYRAYNLYKKWIKDVEFRLNSYSAQVVDRYASCECPTFGPAPAAPPTDGTSDGHCAELEDIRNPSDLIKDVISTVLGVDSVTVESNLAAAAAENPSGDDRSLAGRRADQSFRVNLPAPWSGNLTISVTSRPATPCVSHPIFATGEVWETLFFNKLNADPTRFKQVTSIDEKNALYVVNGFSSAILTPEQWAALGPHYPVDQKMAQFIQRTGRMYSVCATTESPCPQDQKTTLISLPSGLFNFVQSVIRKDSYLYSLYPKSDSSEFVVSSGNYARADVGTPGGGTNTGEGGSVVPGSAGVSASDVSQAYQLKTMVMGFGDATPSSGNDIAFGWVIGSGDPLPPVQSSQLALISVPAWSNELKVKITTGWLTGDSREDARNSYDYSVPLPPDYEAFDSFIGEYQSRRQPKVMDRLFPAQTLEACLPGSILIPGFRLWRSSVVTLGAQRADRIVVLPNMRGIIADFKQVQPPVSLLNTGKATKEELRVWTSEGVDTARERIQIVPPKDEKACSAGNTSSATVP